MMIRLAKLGRAYFTKITPEILPTLKQRLHQTRQLESLTQYYKPDNLEPLLDLVLSTRMTASEANKALDSLFELTSTENDYQINLLANLLKQKAIINSRTGDLPNAISLLEQSISTILLMENPSQLSLSQIYKFVADLSIQINEHKKAEQALREAEHILLILEKEGTDEQRFIDSGLACIYTQLCMIKYRDRRPMEALEELKKSFGYWEKVPRKSLPEYELTCRLKCMLHLLFKENHEAVNSAKEFLVFMQESIQYKKATSERPFVMTKLYFMNIVCMFEEGNKLEGEVVRLLRQFRDEYGEEKLTEMMVMLGIKPDRYDL